MAGARRQSIPEEIKRRADEVVDTLPLTEKLVTGLWARGSVPLLW
jgi:hypothetical protein